MNLRSLLSGLPQTIQYLAVLGVIMLILYVCLTLTRIFGQNFGEKKYYNNPEEYEQQVPDLFASTFLKRRINGSESDANSEDGEKQD